MQYSDFWVRLASGLLAICVVTACSSEEAGPGSSPDESPTDAGPTQNGGGSSSGSGSSGGGGDAPVDASTDAAPPLPQCTQSLECESKVCKLPEGECLPPSTSDGVQNGDETDVDCGGSAPACAPGASCVIATDCTSLVCIASADADAGAGLRCQSPTATDDVKNGDETDVDCGGSQAPACATSERCLVDTDCGSRVCRSAGGVLRCIAPSVADGVHNGDETDVDCGGPAAPSCDDGLSCLGGADCSSLVCKDLGNGPICQVPSDDDDVQNGTETDVDCGGVGNTKCATDQRCLVHSDCRSDGCNHLSRCAEAPSCTVQNGGTSCGAQGASESCCKTLPLGDTFTDSNHPGKRVYLDKFEITAGRMREFIRRIAEANAGVPRIRDWLIANRPAVLWNDARDGQGVPVETTSWTKWLPNSLSETTALPRYNEYKPAADPVVDNPTGNIGTDFVMHIQGWYFYTHGHNLNAGTGFPTFWYARDNRPIGQGELDQKALNATPNALLAAFCVWDGGQLATITALARASGVAYSGSAAGNYAARGRMPALTHNAKAPCIGSNAVCAPSLNQCAADSTYGCPLVNYSNDAGQIHWYPRVPYWAPYVDNDGAPRIAPPGRVTTDATPPLVAGQDPWMDLRGNLNEIAIDDRPNQALRFSGIQFDGIGRNSARSLNGSTRSVHPEYKAGMTGARCMRFREP